MATSAASALAGNADGQNPGGEQTTTDTTTAPEKPWYEATGIDPKFHDVIKAKGWAGPDDLVESYANVEKLVSLERGGDVDRILVKPKADATPEEVAAFRAKAGVAAPAEASEYGFTPEVVGSKVSTLFATAGLPAELAGQFTAEMAPVIEQAQGWFKEAGIPADLASSLVDKVLGSEIEGLKAFNERSTTEYTALQTEKGDKFGDFEETARRAFRASGLETGTLDKIEMAIGTKAMMEMFGKFGSAMNEAQAPQPGKTGGGQFTQTAEQAKSRIDTLSRDSDFQARLNSTNPEVRKQALGEWEGLFKVAAEAS